MTKRTLLALTMMAMAAMAQSRTPAILGPGAHHKQLDTLAGEWNVTVKYRMGSSGPERESTATCSAKWILNGHYLEQQYQGKGMNVLQILGYDNQKKKFFEVKFDDQETGVLRTEGTISPDGKVITNLGDRTDPLSGQVNRLRTVTTITGHDHYTVEWYLKLKDGTETKSVTMVHTRKQP